MSKYSVPAGGSDMPFSVILTEKGAATQRLDFECEEITIGRVDENDICLPKGNISKKHTKVVVKDGKIIVLDLKSTNGTYVNGKKLAGPQVIRPSDKVYIGDFILNVEPPDYADDETADAGASVAPAEAPANGGALEPAEGIVQRAPVAEPVPTPARAARTTPSPRPQFGSTPAPKPAPRTPAAGATAKHKATPAAPDYGQVMSVVHDRLIEALDLRRLDIDALG